MSETIQQTIPNIIPTECDQCGAPIDVGDDVTVVTTFYGGRIANESDYCDEQCAQDANDDAVARQNP